jgi:hypothetical protein
MSDLVGTCPKGFWEEWIAEGDAAGDKTMDLPSGTGDPIFFEVDWSWCTRDRKALTIETGDRFYVVAHGKLRGWAPVVRVDVSGDGENYEIIRRGDAVACTIPETVLGFRGLRRRWWKREDEQPFPDWRIP